MHVTLDLGQSDVVIIGWPASGKSYLAKQLSRDNPQHTLIHTDSYSKYGYKEGLYKLMMDIGVTKRPVIIEGVLGYRLLRKGVELDCFYPQMVIELSITTTRMLKMYSSMRQNKHFPSAYSFAKSLNTILEAYKAMPNSSPPQWHKIANSY
jgi:hypothetical protein